ncbi:MAG: DUF3109 domain-containing protein [Marinilabiliales bacterium]|nr:MAG: DUF3109 domain-containing protein [Marinilabiliales bacterium]
MLQIEDTLISLDLLEVHFICDLSCCKGSCCIEGDSGAPLTNDEIEYLEKNHKKISSYLSAEGKKKIEQDGVFYTDSDHDNVTSLINNKECAYVTFENGITQCAIEKAFENGNSDLQKPISCHLYPVRVKEYKDFTAVNYNKWDICKSALIKGEKHSIPLYQFLKEPLIRRFGQDWFDQLDYAAKHMDELKA